MEDTVKTNCCGVCPKCNSDDIEYYDSYLEDDYYCYKGECNKCKTQFKEWYSLNYVESSY